MVFVGRGFSRDAKKPRKKGFSPWPTLSLDCLAFMTWLHVKFEISGPGHSILSPPSYGPGAATFRFFEILENLEPARCAWSTGRPKCGNIAEQVWPGRAILEYDSWIQGCEGCGPNFEFF